MILEKNRHTRKIVKRLLKLSDSLTGVPFSRMKRPKQITVYHCGPAVLEALFSNLGMRVSQTGVVRTLRAQKKIKAYGLNVNDLGRAANSLGRHKYDFWKKSNSTLNDLNLAINKFKTPVGVEWQGVFYEYADEDDGHYAVITKFDKARGYLRLADSYPVFAGVDRRFRIKDFEKRWWDNNEIKVTGKTKPRTLMDKKMMFVVLPKGETWPKKIGMSRV